MEVICLGEAMLRQASGGLGSITTPGGSELNTAVSLAMLGRKVSWISALGDDPAAKRIRRDALSAGVDLSHVKTLPHPTGKYRITEDSKSPIYQRKNSAFAHLTPQHFPELMRPIFDGVRWLHLSGITPLLGEKPKSLWATAMGWAELDGFLISLDINHRPALGEWEELWAIIKPKLRQIHALHLSTTDLEKMYENDLIETPADQIENAVSEVRRKFGLTWVTCSHKTDENGIRSRWSTMSSVFQQSQSVSTIHSPSSSSLIDPLGGGDAWVGAWLDGMLQGFDEEKVLRRADKYAAMVQSVIGDFSTITDNALEDGLAEATLRTLTIMSQSHTSQNCSTSNTTHKPQNSLSGVIAILRKHEPVKAVDLAIQLVAEGCKAIEVTLDSDKPFETIAAIRSTLPPRILIGVGTISQPETQIPMAQKCGATFALAPNNPKDMVNIAKQHNMLAIPGVANISQTEQAINQGAKAVKLFHWKKDWATKQTGIEDMKHQFSEVLFIPVGGILMTEIDSLHSEGYSTVGIGSQLKIE
ncbi:MAG: hypothetical protein HOB52_06530 [Euryarchaeota archaeon]|nr:hypothetical protein [Euryarchaeota archaeon]